MPCCLVHLACWPLCIEGICPANVFGQAPAGFWSGGKILHTPPSRVTAELLDGVTNDTAQPAQATRNDSNSSTDPPEPAHAHYKLPAAAAAGRSRVQAVPAAVPQLMPPLLVLLLV
jgi:hypothetical protein